MLKKLYIELKYAEMLMKLYMELKYAASLETNAPVPVQ